MSMKIFMYDNGTGREIPEKINAFPVDLLLGSSISEIHKNITNGSQLFCVFSTISGCDIIVQTNQDKEFIEKALEFGKYNYRVDVKESSIWYSSKAEKNIIISGDVDLSKDDLSTLLSMYLQSVKLYKITNKQIKNEMYIVCNNRTGKELLRTPKMDEAMNLCDKNPCCVVLNKLKEVIYTSAFGKVSVPYKSKTHTAHHKSTYTKNNGIFKFKSR